MVNTLTNCSVVKATTRKQLECHIICDERIFFYSIDKNMRTSKKWLDAQSEQNTILRTFPAYLTLVDLKNDDYFKLVIVEIPQSFRCENKPKLKVYKGTTLVSEQTLPGIPSSLKSFYVDDNDPKLPVIAVAIGPAIYFYKNMKPFFKYTFPSLKIDPLEKEIWRKLPFEKSGQIPELVKNLKSIRINELTLMSQKLLSLPEDEQQDFIAKNADKELQRLPTIVAMDTIRRNSSSSSIVSYLVIASESGEVIILDTQSFSVLQHARASAFTSTPSLISVSGQYDYDFRIVIATREGDVCMLRRGWLEGKSIFKIDCPAVGLSLLPIDQTIIVVCIDKTLDCFSKKGKRLWGVILPEPAICMVSITLAHVGQTLVCVALRGGLVQIYSNKVIVDQFSVSESVSAMAFGRLGQEDHVLVLITIEGSLIIKILKRTAEFTVQTIDFYDRPHERSGSLQIPKKTKVFIEQTIRERENAPAIYNNFLTELWRLRLIAARETVEVINSAESTISGDIGQTPIKLAAEVCGLGPVFQVFLIIENMSSRKVASDLCVLLHCDHRHYLLKNPYQKLPLIVPNAPIKINFAVTAVVDPDDGLQPSDLTPESANVRVMILKMNQAKPILAATIAMPTPEIFQQDIY